MEKYPTFVDLVILNPTITVILMAKFNPTITAYLIPYIRELYDDNKIFYYWVSLLLKVEHISYIMDARVLPDMYTLARGAKLHIYKHESSFGMCIPLDLELYCIIVAEVRVFAPVPSPPQNPYQKL